MQQSSYIKIFRQPFTICLWFGQFFSAIGDSLHHMAILWIAYEITGSTSAISTVSVAELIPVILMGFLGGMVIDRWPHIRVLASIDILRAVFIFMIPLFYLNGWLNLWALVIFNMILSFFNSLFVPALQSGLTVFYQPFELRSANGFVDFTQRMGRVVGPGSAGVILAVIPLFHFFTLNAITFVISASIFILMMLVWRERTSTAPVTHKKAARLSDILRGFHHVRNELDLRTLIGIRGLNNIAWSFYLVGTPALVDLKFDGDAGTWGLMITAVTVGQITGNLLIGNLKGDRNPVGLVVGGWCIVGLGFLLLALAPTVLLSLGALWLAGLGAPIANITTDAYLGKMVSQDLLGRVYTLQRMIINLGGVLGLIIGGQIFTFLAPSPGLALAGFFILIVNMCMMSGYLRHNQHTA